MPEPGNDDGWAPLDPELHRPGGGTDPATPPQPEAARPYVPRPSPPDPYAPGPDRPGPDAPGPYTPGPYAPGPQGTGPYVPPQYGPASAPYAPHPSMPGPYYGPYGAYGTPQEKRPWVVDSEPGVPFHRMARTAAHRWWRPLVGSLSLVAVGFVLMMALVLVAFVVQTIATGEPPDSGGDDGTLTGDETVDLGLNLASIALFLPVALLAAWGVQRRRPGSLSSVAGRLRWRWMGLCAVLAVAFCVVSYGTSLTAASLMDDTSGSDEHWVGWGRFLAPAIIILLLVPFQAAAEEYVFRGWLLQAVGACTLENLKGKVGRAFSVVCRTPWPGIVIGAALFTSLHGYTGWGILDIFFFGALAAWMTVRTGGLEAAIALHVFNNLMAFLLPAAIGELDIEQGDVPWQYVVADIVPMVLFAAGVLALARWRRIQTLTPPPEDDSVPVSVAAEDAPEPERVEDAWSDGKVS